MYEIYYARGEEGENIVLVLFRFRHRAGSFDVWVWEGGYTLNEDLMIVYVGTGNRRVFFSLARWFW